MIYVGGRYTCTVRGSKVKAAQCVNCGCAYAYIQSATATGTGRSPYYLDNEGAQRRAGQNAENNLMSTLAADRPAACPKCGWIQPAMFRFLKGSHADVVGTFGAIAAVLAVGLMAAMPLHLVPNCLMVVAILLIALWWILRTNYDPNKLACDRIGKQSGSMPETHPIEEIMAGTQDPAAHANLTAAMEEWKVKAAKNPKAWARNPVMLDESAQRAEAARKAGKFKTEMMIALSSTGVLLALAIPIGLYVDGESDFVKLKDSGRHSTYELNTYLQKHPGDSHTAEVQQMLEEETARQKKLQLKRTDVSKSPGN